MDILVLKEETQFKIKKVKKNYFNSRADQYNLLKPIVNDWTREEVRRGAGKTIITN